MIGRLREIPPGARVALRLVFAVGLLGYVFHQVPFARVAAALGETRASDVVAACFATLGGVFLASRRLEIFTTRLGLTFSLRRLFAINLGTGFYGLFLPGGSVTGGAIRFYKIVRIQGGTARVLAAIGFERIVATLFLCLVGTVLWTVELPSEGATPGIAMAAALAVLLLLCVSLASRPILDRLVSWLDRVGLRALGSRVRRLFEAVHEYRGLSPSTLGAVSALSIAIHGTGIATYVFLARALGIEVPWVTLGWVRSAVLLLTMLPISVSGLGLREGALLVLLRPYGVSGEQAVALSFLIFSVRLIVYGGAGGTIELLGGWRGRAPDGMSSRRSRGHTKEADGG